MQQEAKPGSWPAFYEASAGHILWVDLSGTVVNGGWKPTFPADRLTCWFGGGVNDPALFKWVASAPHSGNYNDVIDAFRQARGDFDGSSNR